MEIFSDPLVMSAILIFPFWKIYSRAGLSPYFSLTLFIPVFGFFIALIILAVSKWEISEEQ